MNNCQTSTALRNAFLAAAFCFGLTGCDWIGSWVGSTPEETVEEKSTADDKLSKKMVSVADLQAATDAVEAAKKDVAEKTSAVQTATQEHEKAAEALAAAKNQAASPPLVVASSLIEIPATLLGKTIMDSQTAPDKPTSTQVAVDAGKLALQAIKLGNVSVPDQIGDAIEVLDQASAANAASQLQRVSAMLKEVSKADMTAGSADALNLLIDASKDASEQDGIVMAAYASFDAMGGVVGALEAMNADAQPDGFDEAVTTATAVYEKLDALATQLSDADLANNPELASVVADASKVKSLISQFSGENTAALTKAEAGAKTALDDATTALEEAKGQQQAAEQALAALSSGDDTSPRDGLIDLLSNWGTTRSPSKIPWTLAFADWQQKTEISRLISSWRVYPAAGAEWFDDAHQQQVKQNLDNWNSVLVSLAPGNVRGKLCTDLDVGLASADDDAVKQNLEALIALANLVSDNPIDQLFADMVAGTKRESTDASQKLIKLWKQAEAPLAVCQSDDEGAEPPSAAASTDRGEASRD